MIYDEPDDRRGRELSDPGAPCAVGGWFMSTVDLTAAVHRLVDTRNVIDENHDTMFAGSGDRLVFSMAGASKAESRCGMAAAGWAGRPVPK